MKTQFLDKRVINFPQCTMYDNQSFQCNLRSEDKYCSGKIRYCKHEKGEGNGLIFDVSESKWLRKLTAQASAFARRILSAWIQKETSARGLELETAARITATTTKTEKITSQHSTKLNTKSPTIRNSTKSNTRRCKQNVELTSYMLLLGQQFDIVCGFNNGGFDFLKQSAFRNTITF